jgi:hypothetical protein
MSAMYLRSSRGRSGSKWGAEGSHRAGIAIEQVLGAIFDVCEGSDLICNVLGRSIENIDVLGLEDRWVDVRVPEIERKRRRLLRIERRSQNVEVITKRVQMIAKTSKMIARSARVSDVIGSATRSSQVLWRGRENIEGSWEGRNMSEMDRKCRSWLKNNVGRQWSIQLSKN